MNRLPIGVFDSGVGGLTVLKALSSRLPAEDLLYLGDTARVPYGTRSPETVQRYASQVAGHLYARGVKALVVACNTATTWAITSLTEAGARLGVPVVGVIEPGVDRALMATGTGHVAVIGTEGTVRGGRYADLLRARRPGVRVDSAACPLFVSLAEEGWTDGPVTRMVAEIYLAPLRGGADTLILGCTHYPLLAKVIAETLPGVAIIDSATATADAAAHMLAEAGLLRDPHEGRGATQYLVTDNLERFADVGAHFLDRIPEPAELVDLDAAAAAMWEGAHPRPGAPR